jgi:multidrug resistance efflux pump
MEPEKKNRLGPVDIRHPNRDPLRRGRQMKSNLQPVEGLAEPVPARHVHVYAPSGAAAAAPAGPRQDASALQNLLEKEFVGQQETAAKTARPSRAGEPLSPMKSRALKTAAGLAILASVGWMPMQRLFQVSSVEAVVNAQVVTLRAPIGGIVASGQVPVRVGAPVSQGNALMTVENARADHGGVDRATENLQSAKEELAAANARIDRLSTLRETLSSRVEDYRGGRIRRVDADMAVAQAQIDSAQAVMDRAAAEVARQSSLTATGVSTKATRETAERDLAVARAALEQAGAQKTALGVEAEALHAGRFFGDSYNDVPQSQQRLDQIDEDLAALAADRGRLEARVARLATELHSESARFDLASRAVLDTPATGRVWEMLTSPGEQVVAGQPLVSVLDCSRLMVTAAVSESVYNTLSVGMPASFTFREDSRTLAGHVVQLSGVAAAASNFAIIPSALTRESYRVTVSADNLAGAASCPVGQTGRVVFGKSAS